MNLPSHIANAPTPMTDVKIQHETNENGIGFQFVSVEDSEQLERIIIWQQEVMEKMVEVVETFEHKHTKGKEAMTSYTQLKQALDDMKKGMG